MDLQAVDAAKYVQTKGLSLNFGQTKELAGACTLPTRKSAIFFSKYYFAGLDGTNLPTRFPFV
jgi:hypothetical protein